MKRSDLRNISEIKCKVLSLYLPNSKVQWLQFIQATQSYRKSQY